jgi:hypothetical protein
LVEGIEDVGCVVHVVLVASVQDLQHLAAVVEGDTLEALGGSCVVLVGPARPESCKGPEEEHAGGEEEQHGEEGEQDPQGVEEISAFEVSCAEDAAGTEEGQQSDGNDGGVNDIAAELSLVEVVIDLYQTMGTLSMVEEREGFKIWIELESVEVSLTKLSKLMGLLVTVLILC